MAMKGDDVDIGLELPLENYERTRKCDLIDHITFKIIAMHVGRWGFPREIISLSKYLHFSLVEIPIVVTKKSRKSDFSAFLTEINNLKG